MLKACQGRSSRLGISANLSQWRLSGFSPVQTVRTLRDRLFILDLNQPGAPKPDDQPTPKLRNSEAVRQCLQEIRGLNLRPTMIAITPLSTLPTEPAESVDTLNSINQILVRLVKP
jgi:hypothetical protein